MKIEIKRCERTDRYTMGRLFVDGDYLCDTLENTDRDYNRNGLFDLPDEMKIAGLTAVPYGFYRVRLDVISPRFARKRGYESIGARMPRLVDVPGFSGVLLHPGNTVADTAGCILVGHRCGAGRLTRSRQAFFNLYERMQKAVDAGQELELTIVGGD